MNQNWVSLLADFGLTPKPDGSAEGIVRGYACSAAFQPTRTGRDIAMAQVRFHIAYYGTAEQRNTVFQALSETLPKQVHVPTRVLLAQTPCGVSIGFVGGFTVNGILKQVPDVLNSLFATLSTAEVQGAEVCPLCGESFDPAQAVRIPVTGALTASCHAECAQTYHTNLQIQAQADAQAFAELPRNYGKGAIGALIGGLAGFAVALFLLYMGYIAAISAFVSLFAAVALYRKFGGHPDKMMVILTTVITFVAMIAALYCGYLLMISKSLAEEGITDVSATQAFRLFMEDAEFSGEFYKDLIMMLVFSVIGTIFEIVNLFRTAGKPNKQL